MRSVTHNCPTFPRTLDTRSSSIPFSEALEVLANFLSFRFEIKCSLEENRTFKTTGASMAATALTVTIKSRWRLSRGSALRSSETRAV